MRTARTCPTCGQIFDANPIGRPKVFCSASCRREMHGIREELPVLERELAETRSLLANDFGGRAHYWRGHIAYLEGAIAEARLRLGAGARPGGEVMTRHFSRGEEDEGHRGRADSRATPAPRPTPGQAISGGCARCERVLPASAFRPDPRTRSGLHSWCKQCTVDNMRAWRAAHRPELRDRARARYAERRGTDD